MACEQEQTELDAVIAQLAQEAQAEADALAKRAESEAAKVGAGLEDDPAVLEAIGAAGGGAIGGPAGGAVGAAIGRVIGQFFTIEIEMRRVNFSLDLPEFRMTTKEIAFDLPAVTLRNRDIIFHTPSTRLERVKVGETPHTRCEGGGWLGLPSCTITWTPNYIDVPVPFMQEQRIVIGVPEVTMERKEISFDVPETRMERQEVGFDVPSVTLRSRLDQAARVQAEAEEMTGRYQGEAAVLAKKAKEAAKERLVPKVSGVFACHRRQIEAQLQSAPLQFDPAIASTQRALAEMSARGVPSDDDDYVTLNRSLGDLIAQRQALVAELQKALDQLTAAEQDAAHQIVGS
ncbi:MAG: hypothetical protein P0Y56_06615 [Candidatus Andeanibacterium colombiense]|uniref:Uncharacterized protein n=1 Tax=Candidatus Andeanibacterium colombiense TaxID=3121345 RepID=A0AAJ6BQY6_9SPHN|nr:MAG: hypothetical protein P0Y56_06615 [Sphingomonadaceae bacterium]